MGIWAAAETFWIPQQSALLHIWGLTLITCFEVLTKFSLSQADVIFFFLSCKCYVLIHLRGTILAYLIGFTPKYGLQLSLLLLKCLFSLLSLTCCLVFEGCSFLKYCFSDLIEAAYCAKIYAKRSRPLQSFIFVKQLFQKDRDKPPHFKAA